MVNMNVVNAITAPGQPASSSNGRIAVNGGLPVVEMPGEAGRMSSMAGGGRGGGLQQQQQQQAVVQQNRQQVLRHQQQRLLLLRHAGEAMVGQEGILDGESDDIYRTSLEIL